MVYLICGKICSGKSFYARKLKEEKNGVILSTDEATFDLINNEQGEFYNVFFLCFNNYLMKKAAERSIAGADVMLDWGFWARADRKNISEYLGKQNVKYQWHYIDVSKERWEQNIEERNKRIREGNGGSDFYLDDGLREKLESMWEEPAEEEIDVWYRLEN